MKYVRKPSEIPKEKHWAAIVFDTVYIHDNGYGKSDSSPTINYIVFDSFTEAEKWAGQQEIPKHGEPKFKLIQAEGATVKVITKLEIG